MPREPRAGDLLIATEVLTDPNFSGSVVLLCEHDDQGTLGLVLNRPLQVELATLLPEAEVGDCPADVHWGGPVKADALHALRHGAPGPDAAEVYPGLAFGGSLDELLELSRAGTAVRFFLGYAGWEAGQLAGELADGAWHVLGPHPQEVFTERSDALWGRMMAEIDPAWKHLRHRPSDPDMN